MTLPFMTYSNHAMKTGCDTHSQSIGSLCPEDWGPLDAPDRIAAGSVYSHVSQFGNGAFALVSSVPRCDSPS